MPTPAAMTSNAQNNTANALAALKGRTQGLADADHSSTEHTVDFASLVRRQIPSGDQFAALQKVTEALEAVAANEDPADVSALLAEISQPLAPTTIPFAPIAQAAPIVLLPASAPAPDPGLAQGAARLVIELGQNTADNTAGFTGESDSQSLGSGQNPGTPQQEFKLQETAPLALAQALTGSTHVQGATTLSAPAGQAVLAANQNINSPQWSDDVGQNLVWMAKNGVETARLSINPPQLGPIEITLSLNKEHATAHFVSAHSEVREVLEQALPRLRQILEGAGVQLGQADVSGQSQQQFAQNSGRARDDGPAFGLEQPTLSDKAAVDASGAVRIQRGNGLVDTFV